MVTTYQGLLSLGLVCGSLLLVDKPRAWRAGSVWQTEENIDRGDYDSKRRRTVYVGGDEQGFVSSRIGGGGRLRMRGPLRSAVLFSSFNTQRQSSIPPLSLLPPIIHNHCRGGGHQSLRNCSASMHVYHACVTGSHLVFCLCASSISSALLNCCAAPTRTFREAPPQRVTATGGMTMLESGSLSLTPRVACTVSISSFFSFFSSASAVSISSLPFLCFCPFSSTLLSFCFW